MFSLARWVRSGNGTEGLKSPSSDILTSEEKIRLIVNPKSEDLRVFYPGAAYDIKSALSYTDASHYVFQDLIDPAYGKKSQQLQKIKEHVHHKGGTEYAVSWETESKCLIRFKLDGRSRQISYYLESDVLRETPPELVEGFDIYISKGAGPFDKPEFIAERLSQIRKDGFIITHKCDFLEGSRFYNIAKYGEPYNFRFSEIGLNVVGEWEIGDSFPATVIQKTEMLAKELILGAILPKVIEMKVNGLLDLAEYRKFIPPGGLSDESPSDETYRSFLRTISHPFLTNMEWDLHKDICAIREMVRWFTQSEFYRDEIARALGDIIDGQDKLSHEDYAKLYPKIAEVQEHFRGLINGAESSNTCLRKNAEKVSSITEEK